MEHTSTENTKCFDEWFDVNETLYEKLFSNRAKSWLVVIFCPYCEKEIKSPGFELRRI